MKILPFLIFILLSVSANTALARFCPIREEAEALGALDLFLNRCVERARFDVPTAGAPIPVEIFSSPDATQRAIDVTKAAILKSGIALQTLGDYRSLPVVIYLSPRELAVADPNSLDSEYDWGRTLVFDGYGDPTGTPNHCGIAMFHQSAGDYFELTVAHEFFHCVQFTYFQQKMNNEGADWWYESTAEWFGNYVYSGTDNSDSWVASFDEDSANYPVTQLPYAGIVFMWWLENTYGARKIMQLMEAMTPTGSQEEALAAFLTPEEMLKFAQDYLDQSIVQTGGRAIASSPNYGPEIRNDADLHLDTDFEAPRFVLYRANLRLDCGQWRFSDNIASGLSAQEQNLDGNWAAFPPEVSSNDSGILDFQIAGIGTGPNGFNETLTADKSRCIPCEAAHYTDDGPEACLIGSWHMVSGGMGAFQAGVANYTGGFKNVDFPDPETSLTLNADGTFAVGPFDSGEFDILDRDRYEHIDMTIEMTRAGTWSATKYIFERCYEPGNGLSVSGSGNGNAFSLAFDDLGTKQEFTSEKHYTCEGDHLDIDYMRYLFKTIQQNYVRVSP